MRIFSIPGFVTDLYDHLVWRIPGEGNKVYITFDDGPCESTTPWILQTLEDFGARATFFCVGENVTNHPTLMKMMKDQGHALGNHTYNHLNASKTSNTAYLENVQKCREVLDTNLFRPPYGRISKYLANKINASGLEVIMWTVLTYDFDAGIESYKILRKTKRQTSPGAIIVFHDSVKAFDHLKKILPPYLEYCKASGYEFLTINSLKN